MRDGGRADVRDGGRADVHAGGWADVHAGGRAYVLDGGRAAVLAGGRADVRDGGRADVHAGGWADVHAGGRADVLDGGRAAVLAGGRADVHAGGRADVRGSATAHLYEGSQATAAKYTAVFLHSQRVNLDSSGAVIDLTQIDLKDAAQWCEFNGVDVVDGIAFVYKAVGDDWKSQRGTSYEPGSTPEAPDWKPVAYCGNGLHFCASPTLALEYFPEATRFVRCGVRLDEMVPLDDKAKAKRVVVPCAEVDRHGEVKE
ncbi:hypothetical protein BMG05_10445 [Mycobacterium malmoense]|nr:hypothetical protein BMG05_10445 [Mycobacterium malmoense]